MCDGRVHSQEDFRLVIKILAEAKTDGSPVVLYLQSEVEAKENNKTFSILWTNKILEDKILG